MSESSNSLTWVAGDPVKSSILVPEDWTPTRLAITATCLVFPSGPFRKLLLCNPHPESWNKWMFPYGSISGDLDHSLRNATLGNLEESARAADVTHDGLEDLKVGMLKMAGAVAAPVTQFAEIFELKFSVTSKSWTLYHFFYFSSEVNFLTPNSENVLVDLAGGSGFAHQISKWATENSYSLQPSVVTALDLFEQIAGTKH